MDQIDRRILAIVQRDADLPIKTVADSVGLSPSAVERRLARLKKDGVIERVVAVVDPRALNSPLTVLIEVEIQNEHRHNLEQFQRWISAAPEVQSCWYVTGDADYVLLVSVRDLDHYNDLVDRLMFDHQHLVRKYKSLVALKTVKRSLYVSPEGT